VYYSAIGVTISYNLARLYEAKHEYDLAEKAYRSILSKYPRYIDCLLRLGCMCRERGQIHDASEWFKEALHINQSHADAWSLIGNLHLAKEQLGPAQHQFERILKINENDTYSQVGLGNIWLHTLYQGSKDKERERRHEQRALMMYKQVLKIDPKNIWAANGVGAVLAHKGLLNEARDIFAQVREATADFCDVWLNIAHILVEQKQYIRAIQMYENCAKKFFKHTNVEVLLYWARALFKANKLVECKHILLKARHVTPEDAILMHNVALVQQKLAKQILSDHKSNLRSVQNAVNDLKVAHRTFIWLSKTGDVERSQFQIKYDFRNDVHEAKMCQDLLNQATHRMSRAKRLDEEERELKKRQEEEIQLLKQKQAQEEAEREQQLEMQRLALEEKRAEYVKKTQGLMKSIPELEDRGRDKSSKKRSKKEVTDFVTSSDSDNPADNGNKPPKSKKSKKTSTKKRKADVEISDLDDFLSSSTNSDNEREEEATQDVDSANDQNNSAEETVQNNVTKEPKKTSRM
jgi:RNA polymerase-associated protein CTR9